MPATAAPTRARATAPARRTATPPCADTPRPCARAAPPPGAGRPQRSSTLPSRGPAAPRAEPAAPATVVVDADPPLDELKAQLLDSLFGTERGLAASSEVRAEINELITQLEARSPAAPLDAAPAALDGVWKLVYTSNSELIALLALGRLPFCAVGDVTQTIDGGTAVNALQLTVPFSRTRLSAAARVEVRSPKRLQVRFERGTVATPELLQDVDLPDRVTLLGQAVDLTGLKAALAPAREAARGAAARLAAAVSRAPDLTFPITTDKAQTWLINTYLDEDTRITRGDGGSVFVLVKDASLDAAPPAGRVETDGEAQFDE